MTIVLIIFKDIKEIAVTTKDILKGVNATVWGGAEEAKKVSDIVKGGLSGADVIIGTSHAIEDFGCKDFICGSLDVIGSISSGAGLILGNIPQTRYLTRITGTITVTCRGVRYYCKKYGTAWGCILATGEGVKTVVKNKLTVNS